MGPGCLLVFTKPARPGRVKTRLVEGAAGGRAIGVAEAATLHAALLADLCTRLASGADREIRLRVMWDLEAGEGVPPLPEELGGVIHVDSARQYGRDLGERLFHALGDAAREYPVVAAVGSDHPTLDLAAVRCALAALAAGEADVALGPSLDGGYYLIGVRRDSLSPRLFADIDWSTERVLAQTRERCRELALRVFELPAARDVDRAEDVVALAAEIAALEAAGEAVPCPRTREVLAGWGLLPPPPAAAAGDDEGSRACAS